ncbi:MAG TPA: NAD(P)H-dependent oxidoreductase [Fibrobacteria bacterium]|nr:NAD(P)H-dependent oxidoreductase [Fibrobacteria bacterium]
MNRILILFAHPALEKSKVNLQLIQEVRGLPGVTFHDLYETYPDFQIDVKREQKLVEAHDILILQHPFYWYGSPAILKEWQDLVLEYGYAYGKGGNAFAGKLMLNAITTGGPREAYRPEGPNRFTVRQFLAPFDQTAHLCNMIYLAPFVIHRSLFITTTEACRPFASTYRKLVEALRDGGLDIEAARKAERINDLLPGYAGKPGAPI